MSGVKLTAAQRRMVGLIRVEAIVRAGQALYGWRSIVRTVATVDEGRAVQASMAKEYGRSLKCPVAIEVCDGRAWRNVDSDAGRAALATSKEPARG